MSFRALRIRSDDGKVSAAIEQVERDELDSGEVAVRVAYSSVNYKDALAATGAGRIIRRFPCIGGIDLAGTVDTSSDPRFKPGDAVIVTSYDLGVAHDGGYAQYARVPAAWVVPLPAGLSLFDSMAYGTAGYTAALAVVRMETNGLAPANGPIVVSGASGGVGSIAVAILAKLGYQVVALTGKAHEAEYLRALGAHKVLLRGDIDFAKIRPLERAEWAGGVDNLGGPVLAWMLAAAKQGATIASVGLAATPDLQTTVMPLILRGASLLGIDSGYTPMSVRREVWRRVATDMHIVDLGRIATTIPLDALLATFPRFIAGEAKGRIVVDLAR
ncbi:MAG: oxidoreductase [Burkholderiales bacterium]